MKKNVKIILFILLILLIIYFNYVTKINNKENMENIFLHGGPDTNSSDNHSKMNNLTKINHNIRKSITGKFIEYGPPGAKESYDFNIKHVIVLLLKVQKKTI